MSAHVADALQHIEWAHEQQLREGSTEHTVEGLGTLAQAYATLAVAEQLRTANAIAVLQVEQLGDVPTTVAMAAEVRTRIERTNVLRAQIREGLGLS